MAVPQHIDSACEVCGAPLTPRGHGFSDEWECSVMTVPACAGVYLDWSRKKTRRVMGSSLKRWFDMKVRWPIASWFCAKFDHRPGDGDFMVICKRCGLLLKIDSVAVAEIIEQEDARERGDWREL